MADAGDTSVELLFFDTFSHENTEELNLDLVQFPHPVIIYEVRIIPLRAQVQANLAGGVRLGATNPSAFKLELFVNNLTRPNAATFEKLGLLDYKENTNIQLKPEAEVPTDGLVLKGWYNTVTVAIYGCITSAKPAKASPPPPPPPRKVPEPRHEARHEPAMTEEELCKSAPSTQHPLDFIQHQLQQLQQKFPTQVNPLPVPGPGPGPGPKPSQPPPAPSSQDIFKPFEQLLQPHPRETHEQVREPKRDFTFPPEPKEPYDAREREVGRDPHHEETRSRDSRDRDDWEYRRERRGSGDSRDSRDYAGSREGSQDSRDFRDKDRERARYRDREEFELDRERERERDREREREREREQWEREREREKELEREREREREQREREKREREQREREQREREQREREAWEQKRERERLEEQERENAQKPKAWEPAQPRTPPLPEARTSPPRSQSRSRSRSPVVHDSRPPEPPMPPEEEMAVAEVEEAVPGDVEMYENLSENSPHVELAVEREAPQEEEDGYEDISSDDELNDGEETELMRQQTMEFSEDMTEDTWSSSTMFNPLQSYLVPLAMFRDPSMTAYEVEVCVYNQLSGEEKQRPAEAQGLLAIIEQFAKAEHTEKWVSALEAVAPLLNKGLSYLFHVDKKKRLLDTLRDWTLEGLSEEKAMQQPEATFKVRHLKMGIHLATALLNCEPSVSMVLVAAGVQSKLIDLLESKFMAFSIRLLILKALDASLRFANGVRWFLGSHPQQTQKKLKDQLSAYHRVVQLMSNKQLAQVMMGMNGLLRKAHTYETFMKLRAAIDHVLDSLPSVEEEEGGGKGLGGGEDGDEEMEHPESNLPVEEEDVDTIVACLDEIYRLLVLPHHLINQPKSLLPVKSLSERSAVKPAEIYPSLFRLAYHCRLLECLFVLMATGATASQASIFVATRRIIHILLQSQEGLLFFSTRPDTTNGIIRSLVQMTDETCEESGEDMVARQLGLEMVYHLHTMQHIDQLLEYLKKVGEVMPVDDAEPLGILHSLYSMTFTPGLRDCVMGRRAIAHVCGLANNFSTLLPFVQSSGDESRDAAQRKSVCWGYTTQLITMIVAHAEGTQIVEKFGTRLLTISEDNTTSSKLSQLQEWLAPIKKLTAIGVEEVGAMAGLLKTYAEDVSKMPPALITVLRLLHNLAVPPPYLSALDDEFPAPLHYNYVVVELYSADCFPVFVAILQKLSEAQLKPWQQGVPQSLDHWTLFFATVMPALAIVKATISLIIQARSSEFKDMTVLSTLLELHTVVCSVPASALYNMETLKVQKDIVDALLAFTQPDFKTQGEEALSNSMWTLMMKEVIRYAIKSPYVYMSGLLLISELVPLPFPLLAKEPLETEEISLAVNTRKLWSAHLHPLMPDIHSLVSLLAGTGCQPLLCLLRRVCWQIADLAAPSATIIAKCLLDVYLEQRVLEVSGEEEKKEGEKEKEGKEEGEGSSTSPMTTKILSLISYLLSQPGIKSAILQLISAGSSEEKYKLLLTSLVQTMNHVSSKPQHVQAQEAIVSVLQSLCDQEITLVAQDTNMSLPEQLACTLPDKELMSQIVVALLEHIGNPSHSYASLLPCVRTLVMLTEHDYGFYHLKMGLESSPGVLVSILRHINATFSKDSSDCLSTLSCILELLRLLTTTDSTDDGLPVTRTRTLTRLQLAQILDWTPNKHHPLQDLEEMAKEEEALETLSESISLVMSLLRDSSSHSSSGQDQWEVTLPSSISLLELFAQRSVYTLTDSDDDRLSASCWLANPALEEPDAEPEVIKCDLLTWCKRYLPDLDIEEELKKETEDRQEDIVRPKRPRDRRKSQEVININRGRPGKKPFVAPMRGRGIMAQSMVQRGGHDLFRSRPPNTSRPPSMHVDDFVKMENTRNQMQPPLQPTPPGPVLPRRDKEIPRGRGRGVMERGGRGGFSTGRVPFFSPPANYPRRDSAPHGGHNLHMFAVPPMMGSHRPKQSFPGPRQFPHEAGHDAHPVGGLLDRHDVRDNRFSPRGGRGPWFGGQTKDIGPGRFMRGGGGGGFHGRREPDRHQRSFTK